ncbi:hypothetical protein [Methanoculleus sp.]|jgi:hypothetical protein|uniref:hypothetical protein n=1 Tax=Methanoculleus sp. TaxID=90427 RepID=UPI0025F0B8CD|nr:hypothetical protein [Methanoculleus sp.]MCK9319383.1 hypothetical protein [Methanoculleus sp.]
MIKNDDGSVVIEENDLANDTDVVDTTGIVDEKFKSELQTTIAKKKAWREKAIDPESKKSYKELYESIKNNKATETPTEVKKEVSNVPDTVVADVQMLKMEAQKRTFQYANKLSPEQVDHIFAYAKGMGIEPKEALDKPFIKKVINEISNDEEASNASLAPSRRAPMQVSGKTFAQMTPEERKANFNSFVKK